MRPYVGVLASFNASRCLASRFTQLPVSMFVNTLVDVAIGRYPERPRVAANGSTTSEHQLRTEIKLMTKRREEDKKTQPPPEASRSLTARLEQRPKTLHLRGNAKTSVSHDSVSNAMPIWLKAKMPSVGTTTRNQRHKQALTPNTYELTEE
eukprot:5360204-Amphidinium_carterae.2